METQVRTAKIDENNGEKIKKVQVKKVDPAMETRRAALGELGNKPIIKASESQKDNIKESKYIVKLKNTKPRVDTYWKKMPDAPKQVVKIETHKCTVPTIVTARVSELPSKKTIAVKAVNNEKKVSKKVVAKQKPENNGVAIRREDSNLSRRSLTKLKAALSKDKKEKVESGREKAKIELKFMGLQSHSEKLLNEIENIDVDDTVNPILVSEYVNDIYSYLYHLEVAFPIEEHHLKNQKEVTPRMRSVLIDWLNEVHYQFHLMAETFHMTVGIIDRYLQNVSAPRDQLQLVGVTALFIAAKYEELYPPEIGDFVYITDDTYNKTQILDMEKKIMRSLDFQMGRPLSIHFLRRYSKAAKAVEYHHLLSKYFLELTSIEYSLAHYKPSEIAASSLYLSLQLLKNSVDDKSEQSWTPTLEFYSRYNVEHLLPIVKKIAQVVKNASSAKLKAVYNKYQSPKFEKISSKPELNGPLIDKLCSE